MTASSFEGVVLCGISTPFGMLSPARGKITHVLLTRAPLYRGRSPFSCDLHVLGAPLTFALSQDQTLQLNLEQTGRSQFESTLTTRSSSELPPYRLLGPTNRAPSPLPGWSSLISSSAIQFSETDDQPTFRRCPLLISRLRGPCFYFTRPTASTKTFQKSSPGETCLLGEFSDA